MPQPRQAPSSGEVSCRPRRHARPGRPQGHRPFVGVIARMPRYVKLGWRLMNDPTVSGARQGGARRRAGLRDLADRSGPGLHPGARASLTTWRSLLLAVRMALRSALRPRSPSVTCARSGSPGRRSSGDSSRSARRPIWLARRGGALAVRARARRCSMAAAGASDQERHRRPRARRPAPAGDDRTGRVAEIQAAAERIAPYARRTPLLDPRPDHPAARCPGTSCSSWRASRSQDRSSRGAP